MFQGRNEETQTKRVQFNDGEYSQENSASQETQEINEEDNSNSETNTTPIKFKTLAVIYARCHMSIAELESYIKAAENVAW